jgi:hypothetical protein
MFRFGGLRDRVGGDDRGAALVEFAFIIPLFMMLVLGMISGGILYNQKMQLTHAAREGARYAATVPADQIFTSGTWAENMRKLVAERSAGELTAASDICVALVEGNNAPGSPLKAVSNAHTTQPGLGNGECFDDTSSGEASRRVQVGVRKPGRLDALFVNIDLTLSSRAGAKHETST